MPGVVEDDTVKSKLDGLKECGCMAMMKTKFCLGLLGTLLVVVVVGCVNTVSGRKTAAVPFVKDRVSGRYERSPEAALVAAKAVITNLGVLLSEGILYNQTNAVKTLEGKVNQRKVWVRIEALDPKITEVSVQARTSAGGTDIELTHEIEKQIALKLAVP